MFRRLVLLAGAGALVISGLAANSARASLVPPGVTCVIKGVANITPGLTTKAKPTSYSFSGTLSSCTSTGGTVVKTGTVTSSGSGTASCASSKLTGTANIVWNNGQSTSAALVITGAGAVVVVQAASTSGTAFAGLQARAALAFSANPAQCNTTTGVATASFTGTVRIGHP